MQTVVIKAIMIQKVILIIIKKEVNVVDISFRHKFVRYNRYYAVQFTDVNFNYQRTIVHTCSLEVKK